MKCSCSFTLIVSVTWWLLQFIKFRWIICLHCYCMSAGQFVTAWLPFIPLAILWKRLRHMLLWGSKLRCCSCTDSIWFIRSVIFDKGRLFISLSGPLSRPFLVNELEPQHLLHDRRKVYEVWLWISSYQGFPLSPSIHLLNVFLCMNLVFRIFMVIKVECQ